MSSNPAGAELFVDQKRVGETPMDLRLSRDRDHSVYVKKEGFTPELVVLTLRSAQDGRKFLTPADVFVDLLNRVGLPARAGSDPGAPAGGSPGARSEGSGARDRDVQIRPDPKRTPDSRRTPDPDRDELPPR